MLSNAHIKMMVLQPLWLNFHCKGLENLRDHKCSAGCHNYNNTVPHNINDTRVRTLSSLRNVSFNVVDDLSKVDVANEVSDEAVQQQWTDNTHTDHRSLGSFLTRSTYTVCTTSYSTLQLRYFKCNTAACRHITVIHWAQVFCMCNADCSNANQTVCPFAFRYHGNGATSCQYIDTTRKVFDCATTLPLTVFI